MERREEKELKSREWGEEEREETNFLAAKKDTRVRVATSTT